MRSSSKLTIAAAAAVAMLAAACGSSSSSGGGGGGGGTITVGEITPLTGQHASVGSWLVHGAQVGVYAVNQGGGVMGQKLKIQLADDAGDSVDALPALRKLLLSNPKFIVGPFSYTIDTLIKDFGPAHVVDFTVGGTTTIDHMQYPYVFRTTPSDSTMAAGMAAFAIQKGYKHCAMVFDTSAAAQSLVPYVRAAYTKNGGSLVADLSLAPGQTSYRSEVTKLQAAKPDCIFMQTGDPTAVTLFADMVQLGAMTYPIVSTDTGADAKFAAAMGWQYAEKLLTGMNGAPPQGPAYATYTQNYQAVWKTNHPLTLSENGYDGVILGALAMIDAKSTDPKVWVNKVTDVSNPPGQKCYTFPTCAALLKSGKKIDYEGATGPENFNQYHNVSGEWAVVRFDQSHNLQTVATIPASVVSQYSTAFGNVK